MTGPQVLIAILTITLRCAVLRSESCPAVPCDIDFQPKTQYRLFDMNGHPLDSSLAYLILKGESISECFINTTDIWSRFHLTDYPQVAMIAIHCLNRQRACMLPYKGRRYLEVVSYVQVTGCNTTIADWNQLGIAMDLRVLTVMESAYGHEFANTSAESCAGLKNVVSLVYANSEETNPDIQGLFSCTPVYMEMAEVVFQNMSWSHLPEEFVTLFPNLQTLELPFNNFTSPPTIFPWTDEEHFLPRNLSRSAYMANHYSVSIDLDVQPNKYRRLFNLANNKILNLTGYAFHGYLQMINLKGNGMTHIGETVFQKVTGLQNIDLSDNYLTSLPAGLLSGLSSIRRFDASRNHLKSLPDGLFLDATALRYLSFANNSITMLQSGLFRNLGKLEELHLEHNYLTTLHTDTFPVDSIFLRAIFFHGNPIKKLPEFIFWIRKLQNADFQNSEITFNNLTDFLRKMDTGRLVASIIDSASDIDMTDIKQRARQLRVINLSGSKVKSIYLKQLNDEIKKTVLILLHHFKFILTNNPLTCDCNILPLSHLIQEFIYNKTVTRDEYYFKEWVCQYPTELKNRPLLSVEDDETYCLAGGMIGCPSECKCFKRSASENIIVDCRDLDLKKLHDKLPTGILELWYSGNNITSLESQNFFSQVQVLDVSFNKISRISDNVFEQARQLKDLRLQSNLLTYIPRSIEHLNLQNIQLMHNNFRCDCNSLWMKHWILNNRHVIPNWNEISCSNKASGRHFCDVADCDFICDPEFDSTRAVIIPSVICSVLLCIAVTIGVLIYTYRLECKVLMYVYLGVHPFDRDIDPSEEYLDCVVVHSGNNTDWVMNNIVKILESNDYRFVVCDMARDFVVGFSMQENLTGMVRHSKRIIFCMSNDWEETNETFKLAWNISQEKIKETRLNYGIIVNHGVEAKKVTHKELLRLMKRGRFINAREKLFVEKIVYSMPRRQQGTKEENDKNEDNDSSGTSTMRHIPLSFIETEDDISTDVEPTSPGLHIQGCHAFISYSYDDVEYAIQYVKPLLESKGYKLCIADRDFIPGAPKEENILAAIHSSKRTLFILSNSHIHDEWSLFTFRAACEKSLRDRINHLIVIVKDEIEPSLLDKEVQHYLTTYVCLNANDRWFEQKLFNGLPLLKHSEELHTSPLFTKCVDIENVAFEISE